MKKSRFDITKEMKKRKISVGLSNMSLNGRKYKKMNLRSDVEETGYILDRITKFVFKDDLKEYFSKSTYEERLSCIDKMIKKSSGEAFELELALEPKGSPRIEIAKYKANKTKLVDPNTLMIGMKWKAEDSENLYTMGKANKKVQKKSYYKTHMSRKKTLTSPKYLMDLISMSYLINNLDEYLVQNNEEVAMTLLSYSEKVRIMIKAVLEGYEINPGKNDKLTANDIKESVEKFLEIIPLTNEELINLHVREYSFFKRDEKCLNGLYHFVGYATMMKELSSGIKKVTKERIKQWKAYEGGRLHPHNFLSYVMDGIGKITLVALREEAEELMADSNRRNQERSDYAKSFEYKKNIPNYMVEAAENSKFNDWFGKVEFDRIVDLKHIKKVIDDFEKFAGAINLSIYNDHALRFRRLGHLKADGVYFADFKTLCVDPRHIDATVHETFHMLDYTLHPTKRLSSLSDFKYVLFMYRKAVEKNIYRLDADDPFKKQWNGKGKYNSKYFLSSTEVFARCGEIYSEELLSKDTLVMDFGRKTTVYPKDTALRKAIKNYFDRILSVETDNESSEVACGNTFKKTKMKESITNKGLTFVTPKIVDSHDVEFGKQLMFDL